jgi:glycerol-3-phosphate dehydrogenase (NAD(P)+)
MQRLSVIGAGAWGTALALAARQAGREVTLWARRPELAEDITRQCENRAYLPGVKVDPDIHVVSSLAEAAGGDAVLLATTAQHLRSVLRSLAPLLPPKTPVVICAKGIELQSGLLLTQIAEEWLPLCRIAVLSGPTFAAEVARRLPAAVTLAAVDPATGRQLVTALGTAAFRPYLSDDLVGAQIGGAVKNVVAIACGIVAGRGLGDNARAALLTRGLAEMARLGLALGAKRETLMGLSGLGDLALTCNAAQSRNFSLGLQLGQGRRLADILSERRAVTEGVSTAPAVLTLAGRHGVEMPITAGVAEIMNGAAILQVVTDLLARRFKYELG